MKLIYLTGFGLPTEWAHGIQVMKMCEAFADLGAQVELMAPRRRNEVKADPFDYYTVKNNFKINKLPCLDICPGDASGFYFWLRLISFLLVARSRLFLKNYDVLYTRDQFAGVFFRRFILELHSLPATPKKWQKKIWQKAGKLIVLNDLMKRELIGFGIREEKILTAPDAVDLKEFDLKITKQEVRGKIGLPPDKRIVMYAGSFYLHDWKGVDILLEANRELPDDYLLVLVGGEKEELEKIQKKYGGNNLLLAGRKRYKDIPYYFKSADVLVLPNKSGSANSEKYTSPLKMFEYMASGAPIVASDLPSIREILNSHNAILVEPDDPQKLAAGIRRAAEDAVFSASLAQKALGDAANFTWQKRAKNIINSVS